MQSAVSGPPTGIPFTPKMILAEAGAMASPFALPPRPCAKRMACLGTSNGNFLRKPEAEHHPHPGLQRSATRQGAEKCRPNGLADRTAGNPCAPRALLVGAGSSPLTRCHAGIRTSRGPKPPASARPAPDGRRPFVGAGGDGPGATAPQGAGETRCAFPPPAQAIPSPGPGRFHGRQAAGLLSQQPARNCKSHQQQGPCFCSLPSTCHPRCSSVSGCLPW